MEGVESTESINNTVLVLIPKVKIPLYFHNFDPSVCTNVLYIDS